ncbi:MAG TPA: hypothetical protein VKF84_17590 [Candidatus Sulfotelmatobacter sp.]|nr:hypothetical protein [Candidatus Sulfotelmatobacter sp.]
MFRVKNSPRFCWIAVAAMLSILCGACGSSSSNTLSQAQAQAVTEQLSHALDQALTTAITSNALAEKAVHPSLATVVKDIHSDQSSPCTTTATGENCNFPVSDNVACPGGGTIAVTGDVDGALNNNGGGSIQTALTITPTGCSVSNLVISGDPSVSVAGQINFTQSAPVFPITLTETGGVSYGPKPSGSCQLNVTYTISSETSCTISGTACGRSVSGSC